MRVLLIDPWGVANTAEYLNGLISGLSRKVELTVITNYHFKCKDDNDYNSKIYRWFFKKSENMKARSLRKVIRGIEYLFTYEKIIRNLKKEKRPQLPDSDPLALHAVTRSGKEKPVLCYTQYLSKSLFRCDKKQSM